MSERHATNDRPRDPASGRVIPHGTDEHADAEPTQDQAPEGQARTAPNESRSQSDDRGADSSKRD